MDEDPYVLCLVKVRGENSLRELHLPVECALLTDGELTEYIDQTESLGAPWRFARSDEFSQHFRGEVG